ncbi:MAG: hypothetical protein BGN96_10615 [Bacteroidales bacterium 45-6]|nr:MAG: hypothetical protein BGN96_10615 [Bacteroidales bacterium 45-6]
MNLKITTGRNITAIELENQWLVLENYADKCIDKFVSLHSFHITAQDICWLESFKIFTIYLLSNYEVGASSLILEPLAFCSQEKLTEIFAELIKRKTN